MSSKKEEGTFEKTRKNVGSYALIFLNQIRSFQIKMDQTSINPKGVLPETGGIS